MLSLTLTGYVSSFFLFFCDLSIPLPQVPLELWRENSIFEDFFPNWGFHLIQLKLRNKQIFSPRFIHMTTIKKLPSIKFWYICLISIHQDRYYNIFFIRLKLFPYNVIYFKDYIYDDFTGKVSLSRKLSRSEVENCAKGRGSLN